MFSGLGPEHLERVREIAADRSYRKGAFIFHDGEEADGFYVVVTGKVKVFKISPEGKEQIFHIFGPGEPFGEVPVFAGGAFPANSQALQKTRCLYFSRVQITELITRHPSLALKMLGVLSRRLREFTVQVENLSLKEVDARVAGYFIHMSREQGTREKVELHISKAQLAGLLGTIPETLSRSFARLAGRGLIRVEGREIQILDGEGLVDYSNGF